jgi:hypothetical protein
MKTIIYFTECEYAGDLDNYEKDIRRSGGIIISSEINCLALTARIEVEIDAYFAGKFKQTDSYGFSNLSD